MYYICRVILSQSPNMKFKKNCQFILRRLPAHQLLFRDPFYRRLLIEQTSIWNRGGVVVVVVVVRGCGVRFPR